MDFANLPVDIITDVLVKLPDLPTLYGVVTSNKRIYGAFKNRRTFFLNRVYGNTVFNSFERMFEQDNKTSLVGPFFLQPFEKEIRSLQRFCHKPTLSSRDALALQFSTWKIMIRFKVPMLHFTEFGQILVTLCENSLRTDLVLEMVEDVIESIFKAEFPAMSTFDKRRHEQAHFVKRLAEASCRAGRKMDAIRLLYAFSLSEGFRPDLTTLPPMLRLLKNTPGTSYEEEFVTELLSRHARNRTEHASLPGHHGRTYGDMHYGLTFTSECYLHFVFLQLGRLDDAVTLLHAALRNSSDSTNIVALRRAIAMARRTIKPLKQTRQNQQVLTIRQSVFDRLRTLGTIHMMINAFCAWANDYATDARLYKLPQLSNTVREQTVIALSALPDDSEKAFRYQAAVRALSKAYEEAGVPRERQIRQMKEFLDDDHTNREGGLVSRYRTVNADLPIMTYVAAGHTRSGAEE